MRTYQSIQFTVENDIAVLRLNRPDRMNALSTEMRAEIMDAFARARTSAMGAWVPRWIWSGFCAMNMCR